MTNLLNGRNMSEVEARSFVSGFILDQEEKYEGILAALSNFKDFPQADFSIGEAVMFDATNFEGNPLAIQRASLEYGEGVKVDVYKVTEQENLISELIFGSVTLMNINGEKITNSFFNVDGRTQHLTSYLYDELDIKESTVQLIQNPDYSPFQDSEVSIQNVFKDLTKGCYPGYRHCGKGCGDGMQYGGGVPVDNLDVVCRAHDRCWANFGTNDPCCDKNLVTGAQMVSGDVFLKDLIVAYFGTNAARC